MNLKIEFLQQGKKIKTVVVPLAADLTFEQTRRLLEAEQTLNSLPVNLRVHISITDITEG